MNQRMYSLFERTEDGKHWSRVAQYGLPLNVARRHWQNSLLGQVVYDPTSPDRRRSTRELQLRPVTGRTN